MISDNSGPIMGIDAEKIGYLSVVTGVFLYAFSDALMKYFIPIYGVHQVVLLRTIFRIIPVVICAFFCRINPLKTSRLTENAVRALLATTSTYCFMAAYKFSPMTEVIVVAYTTAIFVIPLSILILKEKFSIPNTSAVLLGFSGMALAFRPGIGIYQWGVIFAAISALMSAMNAVIVKRLSSTESGITIIFYHLVCLLIFSLAIGFDSFTWISGGHLMLLMLGGILGALAQFCTVHAYRLASCSKLASAAYVILIPSTAIDYFFYKKLPDMCAAAGLGLILCGSFVALRKSSKT